MTRVLLAGFIVFGSFVAVAGTASGGGGTQIESAFRIEGYGLIAKIAGSPAANAYCSAAVLEKALDMSAVHVVDRLINPVTDKPIDNYDAWTVPGDIQLLKSSWNKFVSPWAPLTVQGRSVGALIIHEIYRATGICNDNNFKITDRVFQLINGDEIVQKPFSEAFTFSYAYVVRNN